MYYKFAEEMPEESNKLYINLKIDSLHQLIMEPTKTKEHFKTIIDHILANSSEKVIQTGVIKMELSAHELIY